MNKKRILINKTCNFCNEGFSTKKSEKVYCTMNCYNQYRLSKIITVPCSHCNKDITKFSYELTKSKTKNLFCDIHCLGNFNRLQGKFFKHRNNSGRSKFEKFIEMTLTEKYPNLNILYNTRETIGLELDIYIPSLNLAIELNGPTHYKIVYSDELLLRTQNNDRRKMLLCLEHKIELYQIDVSKITSNTCLASLETQNEIQRLIESRF